MLDSSNGHYYYIDIELFSVVENIFINLWYCSTPMEPLLGNATVFMIPDFRFEVIFFLVFCIKRVRLVRE